MLKSVVVKNGIICPCCYRRLWSTKSCTCNSISSAHNELIERIRYGAERWPAPGEKCPTCGVAKGGYHHAGCDFEDSPIPGVRLSKLLTEEETDYAFCKVSPQTLDKDAEKEHSLEACEFAG